MNAVIFDIVGTLAEKKNIVSDEQIAEYLRSRGINIYHQTYSAAQRYVIFVKFGKIPVESYTELARLTIDALEYLPEKTTVEGLAERMEKHFTYTLYPEAREVVNALAKTHRLGIVTTTPRFMFEKGLKLILPKFNVVITGKESKTSKPDPAIYELALERLSAVANETFYIGDEIALDIVPAKKLGMKTIFISREGKTAKEADYNVKTLKECISIIQK